MLETLFRSDFASPAQSSCTVYGLPHTYTPNCNATCQFLLWWLLSTGEAVHCIEILDTKASSVQVTAALALCLVKLIAYWRERFLL